MSTSDAGELELRVVGGERAAPRHGTAQAPRTTTREHQDEMCIEKFKQENRDDGDETPTGQRCHPSASRQEETNKALILRADQNPIGPRFTSCLLFRLSRNNGLDEPEPRLKKKLDPCLHSETGIQRAETGDSSSQIIGQTSKLTGDSLLSERIPFPAQKKEELFTDCCNEGETTRDLSITHSFSNGEFGQDECNGLHILHCVPQSRTDTRSVQLERDRKDHTTVKDHSYLVERTNPSRTMLSSTVVTVLAPHWNGRLRRNKRPEGTGNSEAQGSLQDVTNTAANHAHGRFQETTDGSLTDGSQAQFRVPFLGTRRNTVGWSTKSGPPSLNFEPKRKMIQAVSLDGNSGRMGNSKMDAGAVSSVSTAASPLSPLSLNPREQRNPQTSHQCGLPSSKPTTSTLLLSLRRFNSNGRNANAAPSFSEINPSSLGNSPSDRDGKFFTTQLSQTFLSESGRERPKALISPSSISYRTDETGPILSPSPSNQRERNTFDTRFFSASPTDTDPSFSQHRTINGTQSSVSGLKQTYPIRGPSQGQENCWGSDNCTNVLPESSASSPYDRSAFLKSSSLPRRTTLTSTSWWKQVSQDGSSPLMLNDTLNIKENSNTPLVPPCKDNRELASLSPTDNRRFNSQIPNNRDNDNTTESVRKGNMNLVMKTQGGTHNLTQRNAEDSPDHGSDRLVKQQYVSNLKCREPKKPHSLPDVVSSSKISRAAEPATLNHPKDLSRHDVNNGPFTVNVTESPSTLLNPKSSNTPTESSSTYNNNYCTSKSNSTPTSSQNKDSQKFTKPPLSLASTNTSQALQSKTTSGFPLTPNTNFSQNNIHNSTYASSQTPKFRANATPLGFERSFASVQTPVRPKTVTSLSPTVSASSKTNYTPVSTATTNYSFVTGSHLAATTASGTPLPIPPDTVVSSSATTVSSILTPPATPIITNPNYSATSSPKKENTFSSTLESDPKKLHPRVGGKKVRRVTWEDSVDLKHPEPITVEKPEPSLITMSSKSPQSVKVPYIFSFLQSSSPTTNTSPICSTNPKISSMQGVKQGRYRSLSSDTADLASTEQERSKQKHSNTMILDQGRQDSTTPRQQRTLSVESGTPQCRSSAPLSLPPDFGGYKLRYSSPPYSTLMSTRSTQGDSKTIIPRSPLFQQSQLNYTPNFSTCTDPAVAMTLPMSKSPQPMSLPEPLCLPFQNTTNTQGNKKNGISKTDQFNNNHKNNSQDPQNDQILLVDNRFDEAHSPSSTCVTETLVYSIKSKVDAGTAAPKNTTPKPTQHTTKTQVFVETKLNQQSNKLQSKGATREPPSHSDQCSSGSSSTESQLPGGSCNRRMKDSVLSKGRFFSVESNNEQSPKRSRFALKKSVSTPDTGLSRSDSERASKTNNKMDQVLNRLRQTFSTKRSDDDVLFPWKWKRASQTPSVSGSSDISDITVESTQKVVHQEPEEGLMLKDNEKETESTDRCAQNRYALISSSAVGSTKAGDQLCMWSDESTLKTDRDEQNACAEHTENQSQPLLTIHNPTTHQLDFYKENRTDYKPTNLFLSSRDPSPGRTPNPVDYSAPFRKPASSPRSPFSPFNTLSPLSPFTSPDVIDDSVFYSPKPHRRRESPSSCEQGEGISLGGSRRSRASTGPPSPCPGPDKECLASSYANLKYGIEPGRSFSVSSVLSCRPSGPGRISSGSRFMSVGDLSDSALTCGSTSKEFDQWSGNADWTTEYDCQPSKASRLSYFASGPGKMKSRSLPRSFTRCLANWSSEVSGFPPGTTTTSKSSRLWNPNMNICNLWDTEGPPTPPPTPPLSPVSRRMSKPPSLSSPSFPISSGVPQPVDSLCPRGLLPSRSYRSSLTTFEESSDSSSDTTTDDEYYLETGEDKEKETEL